MSPTTPTLTGKYGARRSDGSDSVHRIDWTRNRRDWLLTSVLGGPQLAGEVGMSHVLCHVLNDVDKAPSRGLRSQPVGVLNSHILFAETREHASGEPIDLRD